VDPYVEVTVRDSPANLTPATRARLEALATVGGPLLEWSLLCATLFQRPLYVGKAVRLDQRIRGHLRNGSKLRTYLSEAGLSPHDCTVILAPVTPPVEVESLDDEEGGMSEDSAAGEFEGGEDWDFVEPDLSDPDLSLEGHVDRLVRLAESLVIRSSRPLFNSRQD
jgi:hypothetical protein